MASTPQNFFLPDEFFSTADGLVAATFDSDVTIDVSLQYPNKAEIRVEENVFQSLFKYWTDSKDMHGTVADDLLYKIDYNSNGGVPLSPDFVVGAIVTDTTMNPDLLLSNYLPQDFLRYISHNLFNTTKGVDIFSNERLVLESIDAQCKLALDTKLFSLDGKMLDGDSYPILDPAAPVRAVGAAALVHSNPSLLVMKQILKNDPARFSDITTYQVGTTNWFKMPIMIGDSLSFPITIKAPVNQQKLVLPNSTTIIQDRTYLIKCKVVANATVIPNPYNITYESTMSSLALRY